MEAREAFGDMAVYMKLTSCLIAHASFVIYTDVCIPMHRVNLLGGADATGGFNDTVVYYVAGEWSMRPRLGSAGGHWAASPT